MTKWAFRFGKSRDKSFSQSECRIDMLWNIFVRARPRCFKDFGDFWVPTNLPTWLWVFLHFWNNSLGTKERKTGFSFLGCLSLNYSQYANPPLSLPPSLHLRPSLTLTHHEDQFIKILFRLTFCLQGNSTEQIRYVFVTGNEENILWNTGSVSTYQIAQIGANC